MASASRVSGANGSAVLSLERLGLVGQVATSWGVAGGLLASVVVTLHVLLGTLSSSLGFLTTTLFYLIGSVIGYLHGGILGYLGRAPDTSRGQALRRLALTAAYAVPMLIVGWLTGMLLAMSAASALAGRVAALLTSLLGWAAVLAALGWAVVETRDALGNLWRRWPRSRALMVTLVIVFVALLPAFIVVRPDIWVIGVKPTPTAATAMALGATVWIGGPLGVLGLLAARAWSRRTSTHVREVPRGSE